MINSIYGKLKLYTVYFGAFCTTGCYNSVLVDVDGSKDFLKFHIGADVEKSKEFCVEGADVFDNNNVYYWSIYRDFGKCLKQSDIYYGKIPLGFYQLKPILPLKDGVLYFFHVHGSNVDGGAKFEWHDGKLVSGPMLGGKLPVG